MGADQIIKKIIKIAEEMIIDKTNLIEGCRLLSRLSLDTDESESDFFWFIRGIDADTDDIPIGEARKKWSIQKQLEFDKQEKEYLLKKKKSIIEACQKIISYYKNRIH